MNILGLKDDLMNQLMNHEAVYRTAPATPVLLKSAKKKKKKGGKKKIKKLHVKHDT